MKNTVFIAFSGGCLSGKTTTMKEAKKIFTNYGIKTITLDEIIRKQPIESIDELRRNASKYLELEHKIITEKIKCEEALFKSNEKQVVLCDRAITDSLFYLLFYTDKNSLAVDELDTLNILYNYIDAHAKNAFANIYDLLIEFSPLEVKSNDRFRPSNIDILKYSEYRLIHTLNEAYSQFAPESFASLHIDLNVHFFYSDNTIFGLDMQKIFNPIAENIFKKWKMM